MEIERNNNMPSVAKGASLDPSTHQGGGQTPNGNYDIVKVRASLFQYPGRDATVPAIMVTYRDAGVEYEQMYKAGDTDHLVPSDDGKRFVHPHGEQANIYKGGAASLFLSSLARAGFKFNGDDVSQIEGIRVELENTAAPRGKSEENAAKTFPLVVKILTAAKAGAKTATRPTNAGAATTTATTTAAAPAAASTNGDIGDSAIAAVIEALTVAPEHTLKVKGLAVRCLKFASGAKLNDLTKLMTPEWLTTTGEETGAWACDGESVVGVS
jgi:hypothetical protein